jgi:4a-hydroxytetrahydrobiopterin dehydratase
MQKMTQPLSDTETEVVLSSLPGWVAKDDQLVKTFVFGSFREAMSFIVRISYEAEDMNHHPEITNVYNRVAISLTTHDAGGRITERDAKLARKIENISWLT